MGNVLITILGHTSSINGGRSVMMVVGGFGPHVVGYICVLFLIRSFDCINFFITIVLKCKNQVIS